MQDRNTILYTSQTPPLAYSAAKSGSGRASISPMRPDSNSPESGTLLELLLDATEESLVAWEQDGELVFPKTRKGYRWWLIPATVINPLISEIRVVPNSTLEN
jgi:hypothetical protein